MESKQQPPSIILQLMGLHKPPAEHSVAVKQKVLSDTYRQKIASIGVIRKKRSSHQCGMNTDEKEESDDVSKVAKALRRGEHHNPSMGNRKENPSSCKNSHFDEQSSRSFSKISDISMQPEDVATKVLNTTSSTFFGGNEAFANDMLKPASNISVNEIQCNAPFFCSDSSYVGFGNQLPMISAHGNEARNLTHLRGYSNDMIERNIRLKVHHRNFPTPRYGTINQDILFQRYWGIRTKASVNWSSWKSANQSINQKQSLEDMNQSNGQERFSSFSSNFNNNIHTEEKRLDGTDLSDKITMAPQLSSSSPSPALLDSQILQERSLMNDVVKNKKYVDTTFSKQNVVSLSPDSSVEFLVSDAMNEVGCRSHNTPTKDQSTPFILAQEIDSLSHSLDASKQQDISDFQEDSAYSLCSEADPDSLGSSEEVYEPSPTSVLDPLLFGQDIPFSSECGDHVYESSDDEFDLNVSSDEDCGNASVFVYKENEDIAGLFREKESRDFSYVVDVLTEAGICNKSLFTDFSTWHSAECPISPSVFEILEKKFGEQQLWKRSERKLFFDRINSGLLRILQPNLYIPMWEKPMSRRLNAEPSQDMIEEEMWGLLVAQEKKSCKELADVNMVGGEIRWIEIVEDVEDIVREIVKLLMEELVDEIVSLENF
ncbi:hypothetical protein Fmac_017221 [Flemingia macrophylla]|uniref:DUF4378 domain-containing protein n=1 Tax=Flemingia macrophylla TaxID=520843 RepID=A0ABD1M1H9_9FABA